jgi:hypothetical protein
MGKHDKLLAKLKSRPKDFSFEEIATLLMGFGYVLNQGGGGSRVKFEHERFAPIFMYKPHPSPLLKPYQIDQVLDVLKQEGLL